MPSPALPRVEISRIELEPGGPRYTVDTLRLLAETDDDLTFLVGADQFAGFRSWREPGAILGLARLAVASRPGFEEEELRPVLAALARPDRVSFFPIPPHPLSSEQIRARVREGLPIDELVPGAVVGRDRSPRPVPALETRRHSFGTSRVRLFGLTGRYFSSDPAGGRLGGGRSEKCRSSRPEPRLRRAPGATLREQNEQRTDVSL